MYTNEYAGKKYTKIIIGLTPPQLRIFDTLQQVIKENDFIKHANDINSAQLGNHRPCPISQLLLKKVQTYIDI